MSLKCWKSPSWYQEGIFQAEGDFVKALRKHWALLRMLEMLSKNNICFLHL